MADNRQPGFRGVQIAERNENGVVLVFLNPRADGSLVTRAYQPIPNFAAITEILGLDGEFQQVFIVRLGRTIQRVGRFSIVNMYGAVIYDVFAFYPEIEGYQKRLPPSWKKLGVYWPDIKPRNGACPIEEVEHNIKQIFARASIAVGHSIANDIKVCSEGVFDGIEVRDTQLYEPYRVHGKLPRRLPKLKVLAKKICNITIQSEEKEHSSVEDAQATTLLAMRVWADLDQQQKGWTAETVLNGTGNTLYVDEDEALELVAAVNVDEITKVCNPTQEASDVSPVFNEDEFPVLTTDITRTPIATASAAVAFWQAQTAKDRTSNSKMLESAAKSIEQATQETNDPTLLSSKDEYPATSLRTEDLVVNSTGVSADSEFGHGRNKSVISLASKSSYSTIASTSITDLSYIESSSSNTSISTMLQESLPDSSDYMMPDSRANHKLAQATDLWAGFRKRDEESAGNSSDAENGQKSAGKKILKLKVSN